jgi:PKD repeat protein
MQLAVNFGMRPTRPRACCAVALSLALALATASPAGAARSGDGVSPAVERALGGQVDRTGDGLYRVSVPGPDLLTHGPDPKAEFEANSHGQAIGPGDPERAPICATSFYERVLYARLAGSPDRFAAETSRIQASVRRIDAVLNEESLLDGGGTADYRVLCDGSGQIQVDQFTVPGTATNFSSIVNAARNAGFNDPDVAYVIFFDGTLSGICGTGNLQADETLSVNNQSNFGGDYAVTYESCWDGRTPMHEIGHTQGAVQNGAPYASGAGHCYDGDFSGSDVMCYDDGGSLIPPTGVFLRCTDLMHFDCGNDTYFDTAPEPGEYLATHWNLGFRGNRFLAFGPGANTPPPPPQFSATCNRVACNFSETSLDYDGSIQSRLWSFGDGTTSTNTNPAHTFPGSGSFQVTLSVFDNDGAEGKTTRTITITNQAPDAAASVSCTSLTCLFTNASTDSDGTIQSHLWTFGDSAAGSTLDAPVHTFAKVGTYQYTLRVTDNLGASSETTGNVIVTAPTLCHRARRSLAGANEAFREAKQAKRQAETPLERSQAVNGIHHAQLRRTRALTRVAKFC